MEALGTAGKCSEGEECEQNLANMLFYDWSFSLSRKEKYILCQLMYYFNENIKLSFFKEL